ncbi:MAG: hypothetical protein M0T71_00430 [Actinomycetota bacterium]|nr:hypothetical protein [Actinomycetota bacterium]
MSFAPSCENGPDVAAISQIVSGAPPLWGRLWWAPLAPAGPPTAPAPSEDDPGRIGAPALAAGAARPAVVDVRARVGQLLAGGGPR